MRRAMGSLLLALFSFTLIAPALRSAAGPETAPCCRRDGKHHCAATISKAPDAGPDGPAWNTEQSKCPFVPGAGFVSGDARFVLTSAAAGVTPEGPDGRAIQRPSPGHPHVSFDSSLPKRGPPVLPS
jgi:hypothetical protein